MAECSSVDFFMKNKSKCCLKICPTKVELIRLGKLKMSRPKPPFTQGVNRLSSLLAQCLKHRQHGQKHRKDGRAGKPKDEDDHGWL